MVGFLVAANPLGEAYITTSNDFHARLEQLHFGDIILDVSDGKKIIQKARDEEAAAQDTLSKDRLAKASRSLQVLSLIHI